MQSRPVSESRVLMTELVLPNDTYLTFVALDETGRPSPVPPLEAESDDRRRRLGAAEERRARRLERREAEGMG